MTVRHLASEVLKLAHARLKPLGFSKNGQTFSRDRHEYVERFVIQGSRWNSGEEPWLFSIEVGVFFPDVPPFAGAKGFWKHCHAVGNAARLVQEGSHGFEVRSTNIEAIAAEVVATIESASDALPALLGPVKPRALKQLISPLPVPNNWSA